MAKQGSLQLEIVTPKGVVLSTRVDEVVAPSVFGEFGVLAGHLPMLAALNTGLVHYQEGNSRVDVAVGGGFVEVLHDKALLLTDRYATKDDVDVLQVRQDLKKVDAKIEKWTGDLSDPERLALIEQEQWLATQLELLGDPPQAKVLEQSRSTEYAGLLPVSDEQSSELAPHEQDT